MKTQLLALAFVLLAGSVFAAGEADAKPLFDKRIDAWAFGTITGVNMDIGYIAVEGQVSEQAVQYSKQVERSLTGVEGAAPETLDQLRAAMAKFEKKEIVLNFEKTSPPPLMQSITKKAADSKPDSRALLSELKIGDVVLVGYDSEPKINYLYATILVQSAMNPVEDPVRAKSKE